MTNRSSISAGNVIGCSGELELPRLDLRQVEHVVHQLEEVPRRLVRPLRCPSCCLVFERAVDVVEQQRVVADDRR